MMSRSPLIGTLLATMLGWATPVLADAAKGHELALQHCARCHNIEPGGAFKQHPPAFAAIAKYRTRDDIWGRIISPSPHAGMPEVVWDLQPNEVQHLLDYIVSLDRP